jgi:hypothetical protein
MCCCLLPEKYTFYSILFYFIIKLKDSSHYHMTFFTFHLKRDTKEWFLRKESGVRIKLEKIILLNHELFKKVFYYDILRNLALK